MLQAGQLPVTCGRYGHPTGVLRGPLRVITRDSTASSFEHAQNLVAGKSDLRALLRATTGVLRAKYFQLRAICEDLRVAKIVPRKSHARLARNDGTGPLDIIYIDYCA